MGLARRKSAQKHRVRSTNTNFNATTADALLPAYLQPELLFIRSDSSNLLMNHIDNLVTSKYSTVDGVLELDFHLLVTFSDGPVEGFFLIRAEAGVDKEHLGELPATPVHSPVIGAQHPTLSWAAHSRFVVSAKVSATGLTPGNLVLIAAKVGDQLRPISRIYITAKAARAAAADQVAAS